MSRYAVPVPRHSSSLSSVMVMADSKQHIAPKRAWGRISANMLGHSHNATSSKEVIAILGTGLSLFFGEYLVK